MTKKTSLIAAIPLVATASFLPFVTAAPAFAAGYVICVGSPSGTCDDNAASINAAAAKADDRIGAETILVGPGTYSDGQFDVYGDMTLKGSGQGATVLTMPASDLGNAVLVAASGASVQDLTIKLATEKTSNDSGLMLFDNASATNVRIDGAGTDNTTGIEAEDSDISGATIRMPLGGESTGIFAGGGTTVTDTTIRAAFGFRHGGGTPDTVSRVHISASLTGVTTDSGTVHLDDAVIDLGSGAGVGLMTSNFNTSPTPMAINANHVTVVGGAAGSRGAYAVAFSQTAKQSSTISLSNSIIQGPATDLSVLAGNNGTVGGNSVAQIITTYTSWSTKVENPQPHGTAQVLTGTGTVDANPKFIDAAAGNYRLKPGSPLVDKGNPAAGGPTSDVDGAARVFDGDANGSSIRDMGAYERTDLVAPQTRFTAKPSKTVATRYVTFKFKSNEAGSSFRCKLDKKAWRPCASPRKLELKVGKHTFKVRATDLSGNTDVTPAVYTFKRVPRSS